MKDLIAYRWVLAPPSVESRQWLNQAFDLKSLSRPVAQVETNFVSLLPPLINQTGLLSFILAAAPRTGTPRFTSEGSSVEGNHDATPVRIILRKGSYLSPAAQRLVHLLRTSGNKLFREEQD